ncbi:hypothetical protein [Methylobacterium indicum]|uniref:hypothetical protein n=1 Tax=Methylobacterium indicum TaxID=1775910 RepID=UPI000F773123|nr:hypothetical protein [Methylobacterium indicum]
MTPRQYRRWYDFARRMALRGFPDATPARRGKIAQEVRYILWILEDRVPDIVDWDNGPSYVGDKVEGVLNAHYHEREFPSGRIEPRGNKFHNQVSCCIRAGLDMAAEPSAGVVGFTVGDLRRMYPLGLPAWVAMHFTTPITSEVDDAAGVWL